ncbi:MAG: aldo/keto reductase [Actinomycetota bacterium]|nr:aldo/keto reductase [Actinomycetota bacterium]
MEHVRFGNTGLRVSRVCLGMMSFGRNEERPWALDEAEARPIVHRAIEGGVTFFDTADVYNGGESEVLTGRIVGEALSREEFVVATKVHGQTMPGPNGRGLGRKHVLASIDESLRRLRLDYVDLYQIHRWDGDTPIEETMEALDDVVRAGKARYIGASSMYAWQFAKAQAVAERNGWTRFVSMQNHYNLIYREEEREMIPLCLDQGVAVMPWSPLARGRLARSDGERPTPRAKTDRFRDSLYPAAELDQPVVDRLRDVAAERGAPPARVALAWLLHKPAVTSPIVGATKVEHVDDALAAERLELSDDEIGRLEEPYVPHAIAGH